MSTTTLTKAHRTLIAAGTSNAAGGSTLGTPVDLRTAQGGLLTVKLTNGASGPTAPAVVNVLVAHTSGATPAAGGAGADWKTLWTFSGVTTANGVVEQAISIDPAVMHLGIQVTGNTGQAVVCEAFLSEITSATTA